VRDVYEVGPEQLLIVATDRISAFDVVLPQPIPHKGVVLTQITAWWLRQGTVFDPNHLITADTGEIIKKLPRIGEFAALLHGRSMLVRKTQPIQIECVVRGYLSGSAWREYQQGGTLAGEPLPAGLRESDQLATPLFSPATKAETGHDENISFAAMSLAIGPRLAGELRDRSIALYKQGQHVAERAEIIVADTKFEFGHVDDVVLLIDEVLTPDSSRFWTRDKYQPGSPQPSLDKQPVRDYLERLAQQGKWNKQAPAPDLPSSVIQETSQRYQELFRRMTGEVIA
jgi:phosphoribosylaminoimidazole-succinocarboxamide synthase